MRLIHNLFYGVYKRIQVYKRSAYIKFLRSIKQSITTVNFSQFLSLFLFLFYLLTPKHGSDLKASSLSSDHGHSNNVTLRIHQCLLIIVIQLMSKSNFSFGATPLSHKIGHSNNANIQISIWATPMPSVLCHSSNDNSMKWYRQ